MALKLDELTEPARLRRSGWEVPARIDYPFRVYDTRLGEKGHLRMMRALGVPDSAKITVVGGDFLTAAAMGVEVLPDHLALKNGQEWWANEGQHIWINPARRSLQRWVNEIEAQMDVGGPATISLALFVGREKVAAEPSITDSLPFLKPLFQMEGVIASVYGVGERVPLRRLPRAPKQLPPQQWTEELSSVDRILVVVHLKRGEAKSNPQLQWLPGTSAPPPPPSPSASRSAVETLVAELLLPPGVHPGSAPRMLDAAMRRLARDESLRPPLEVRKSKADGRMAWGTFRVPSEDALRWLRCSGRNGLLIRPFFTAATTEACSKERFRVHWLRTAEAVDADVLNQLWGSLKELSGVVGLVLSSKDVGVRVDSTNAQTLPALEAALQGKSSQLRQKAPSGNWWCLKNMEDAEPVPSRLPSD